jgi:ATP-binding cassette subfamily B protein
MRNAIFARLENLSFSYYDQAQTGQLMTRVTSDVDTVRNFTGNGLLQLVNAILMLFGSAIILLLTNWRLALIVLTIVPAIFGIFLFFIRRIGPRFRLVQQKLGNLNTILQENLAGVRVVKRLCVSRSHVTVPPTMTCRELDYCARHIIILSADLFIANLGTSGYLVRRCTSNGELNIGELVALHIDLPAVACLHSVHTDINYTVGCRAPCVRVIDAPIEVVDKPDAIALTHLHGRVAFEDVSFRYAGSEI